MKSKRLMAMALACALAVTTTACGSKPASDAGSAPAQPSSNFNAEGLPILKEKETFKVVSLRDALSMKNMDEKACVIKSEEDTNIHVEWQEVPANGWNEKINVIFASNQLPDAISGGIDVMANYRSLLPLNDLIEKYAPNVQKMFEENPSLKAALTAPDGNIYSLPVGGQSPTDDIAGVMWINKDWLDKLNLPMPTTTDELYDVLVAFRDQDPNGNGKKDEIPLAVSSTANDNVLDPMFGLFGTLDISKGEKAFTDVKDGKIVFAPARDEYRDALEWFHKLYAEGLMNQDYFIENGEQFMAKGNADVPLEGVVMTYKPDLAMKADFASSYVVLPPVKGPNGDPVWAGAVTPRGSMGGFVITKQCKSPETMIRWYDYCNQDIDMVNLWNFGPEGTSWKKDDQGRWLQNFDNIPEGMNYAQYRRTEGAFYINTYQVPSFFAPDQNAVTNETLIAKNDANEIYKKYVPADAYTGVGLNKPENVERMNFLQSDLKNYMDTFRSDAIINGVDDTKWADHLKKLEALHTDEDISLHQEFYDHLNSVK